MPDASRAPTSPNPAPERGFFASGFTPVELVAAFAATSLVLFVVFAAALRGDFISDDSVYIQRLARAFSLDQRFLSAAFDPMGELKYAYANYAPLYLIVSRLEWAAFAETTLGYHAVNVLAHALNATLVLVWLGVAGLPRGWAIFAAACFALHPANVEVVAWMSQLRTILALGASLAALLLFERSPLASTLLFAGALLFKISALFCLPVVAAMWWIARVDRERPQIAFRWVAAYLVVFALYAPPQFLGFYDMGRTEAMAYADAGTQLRSMASIAIHYVVMATTTLGLSAFHAPAPVRSWLDPWWLASLPLAGLVLWRLVSGLRRGSQEAVFWVAALAAYAPISQIFPFYFGMGDRYLYFVLPGLIGACMLWIREAFGDLGGRWLVIACVMVVACLGVHSMLRAPLWQAEDRLLLEAARNYPESGLGHYVRAVQAIGRDEPEVALVELRRSLDYDFHLNRGLLEDPYLAPLRSQPGYAELRLEIGRRTLEHLLARSSKGPQTLRSIAGAYFLLGDLAAAEEALEQALRADDGSQRDALLRELMRVREARLEIGE